MSVESSRGLATVPSHSHGEGAASRRAVLGWLLAWAGWNALTPANGSALPLRAPTPLDNQTPWLLNRVNELRPAAPTNPSAVDIAEVRDLQAHVTSATLASIERWDDPRVILPWTMLALDLIKIHELNPVRAARALALFHTAMFDTVVSTLDAQSAFPQPSPAIVDQNLKLLGSTALNPLSFPSEHAAVAAAAAVVLTYLFPDEPSDRLTSLADEAAMSRVSAGRAFRRDIEAGQAIGAVVGQRAVARGMADGSSLAWNGQYAPEGNGVWQPTPPAFIENPIDPLAGTWRPWILPSGNAYRPGPPPTYGSPAFQAELAAVQKAVTRRTSEQVAAVLYWAAGPGTVTPAGLWIEIARNLIMRDELDALQAALVLARTSVAMADSSICCWDAKYTYWTLRPITADPDLDVLIPTPPFPSYTSGHSTISAAATAVLGHVFPTDQTELAAKATEAKDSRLWAGIHFPIDNEMGALGGSVIGRLISQTGEGIYAASADGG